MKRRRSKLYWQLRAGGAFKPIRYQIVYTVTAFHTKNKHLRKPWSTYPSNKWGHGYWTNKHKRRELDYERIYKL